MRHLHEMALNDRVNLLEHWHIREAFLDSLVRYRYHASKLFAGIPAKLTVVGRQQLLLQIEGGGAVG